MGELGIGEEVDIQLERKECCRVDFLNGALLACEAVMGDIVSEDGTVGKYLLSFKGRVSVVPFERRLVRRNLPCVSCAQRGILSTLRIVS